MVISLFLLVIGTNAAWGSTSSDWYYMGAVVNFCPALGTRSTPEENMLENIQAAGAFMANASAQGADIIVFPAVGLVGFGNTPFYSEVPDPQGAVIPCKSASEDITSVIRELSCLAMKYKMYLVVNLPEKFPCSSGDEACPGAQEYHYTTNVVFDRSGTIVARYRKRNLFGEVGLQKTPTVELTTFNTDFGVEFGTFICFDILFEKPSIDLVRKMGVTDIIFTSSWFSEVPFLTALQTQAAFAYALDVNFLASGYSFPPTGSGGSGIYRGKNGPMQTVISGMTGQSTLLVQKVPKKGHWPQGDAVPDPSILDPISTYAGEDPYEEMQRLAMKQDSLDKFNTVLLDRPQPGEELEVERRVCSGSLCCDFQVIGRGLSPYRAVSPRHEKGDLVKYFFNSADSAMNLTEAEEKFDGFHYRMAVFQGVRSHTAPGASTWGVEVCGIIACLSEELASCGRIGKGLTSPRAVWTDFSNLTITGHFAEGRFHMPDTQVGPRYRPLPPSAFLWDEQADVVHLHLQHSVMDLRTFGIFGRVFEWDTIPA